MCREVDGRNHRSLAIVALAACRRNASPRGSGWIEKQFVGRSRLLKTPVCRRATEGSPTRTCEMCCWRSTLPTGGGVATGWLYGLSTTRRSSTGFSRDRGNETRKLRARQRPHSTLGQIRPGGVRSGAHDEGMDAVEDRQQRGFPQCPHAYIFSGKKKEERLKRLS